MSIEMFNYLLALGTVIGQIALIAGLAVYVFLPKQRGQLLAFIQQYGIAIAFVIALASTLLSLFYSDVMGYEPCTLCWWQRIFIYPQIVLLGLALWKREKLIVDYALVLLGIGLLISLYQVYLQVGGAPVGACGVGSVSCTKLYVMEFGYVTIPMMALTGYLLMIGSLIGVKLSENK
jgi:disulfide bond formation protein DsbB